ncbi:MAG: hypothetical protein K6E73_10565 [Bacteroidales bacterium]|nr:hypothetical protein [Bacteroidales bacterium]
MKGWAERLDALRRACVGSCTVVGGEDWRTVPCFINGEGNPCQSCKLRRERDTHQICPGMDACVAHKRPDGQSVKFISADAPYRKNDNT